MPQIGGVKYGLLYSNFARLCYNGERTKVNESMIDKPVRPEPMTQPPAPPASRGLLIVKIILYILAGTVLVLGLIAGISLWTGADKLVVNALLPLQMIGGEIIYNMIAPTLSGFLKNLGILTLVSSLILSALLYTGGRLIGHILHLEERLARLEARS